MTTPWMTLLNGHFFVDSGPLDVQRLLAVRIVRTPILQLHNVCTHAINVLVAVRTARTLCLSLKKTFVLHIRR